MRRQRRVAGGSVARINVRTTAAVRQELARRGGGRGVGAVVAVHHGISTAGNDHVHLVLNLVRGDGRITSTFRDWPRWRQWCREVEDWGS